MLLSIALLSQAALAAPLVAPSINSSRVTTGIKISTEDVAQKLSGVRTISVSGVSGPQSDRFVSAAVDALNDEHQGRYRTVADVSAGAVGGVGKLAAASTGLLGNVANIPGLDNVPGVGLLKERAAGAVDGGAEKAASRLDGVDRHPAEGFGIVETEPNAGDRIREGAEKVLAHEGAIDKAAMVADAVGAGGVEEVLTFGKTAAGVTAAFFRGGVEGNSPRYSGVDLPIRALEGGSADARLSASISAKLVGDEEFKKKVKQKKRNKNGKVVRDKNGKVVWETVELDCIKRTVHVKVDSQLSRQGGGQIVNDKVDRDAIDEACGPKRKQQIGTVDDIAAPVIASAGKAWGSYVQPQMETVRLKFNPSASTALAVDHVMHNRHGSAMCLLLDAEKHDPADPYAKYGRAVLLEAWGRYEDALPLYATAEQHEDFSKGRWNDGAARVGARESALQRMEVAYGMRAQPTSFPYVDSCPAVDRGDAVGVAKRVRLHAGQGEGENRRLHTGEQLKILEVDGKWTQVEQLDGSVGWVKGKRAFEAG